MYQKSYYVDRNSDTILSSEVEEKSFEKLEETTRSRAERLLDQHQLLDYGKKVPKGLLEDIFEVKYSECPDNQWQFNLLWMKTLFERAGFFVTTRGMNGSIRTLSREEMSFYNEKENKKALKAMKSRQKSLYMINPCRS